MLGAEQVGHAAQVAQGTDLFSIGQSPRDGEDRALSHAEGEQVGLGMNQVTGAHLVGPIIVMGHPAQRGLDAAGHHGHTLEGLPAALGIDRRSAVRAQADAAPGRVGVGVAPFPVGRVVVDHGVHIAGADGVEEPRRAQGAPGVGALPIGLGQHRHAKAMGLEPAPQQGRGEGGVIHIGIPGDKDHVGLIPAQGVHLGPAHGEKGAGAGPRAAGLLACRHGRSLRAGEAAILPDPPFARGCPPSPWR